jgi:hypothetical protein
VLQRHAGVAGLPMASCVSRGGGLKRALRSPGRYAAGRCSFVFRPYAAKPTRRERVSRLRRAARWSGAEGAGLDAGASAAYIASPSSRKNRSGQPQARGAAPELRPPARPPRPWEAFHGVPIRGTQPGSKRPFVQPRSAATGEGRGGHAAPALPAQPTSALRPPHCGPSDTPSCPCWQPAQRWPSCWSTQRGQALTQEPCGSTFHTLTSREDRPQRTRDRSGTAAEPAGAVCDP